ncbi:MAG: alcohol dehydrogenase catalytic domain-containing protein [Gammaproteobacteria bacterium]|nr:alcohol dehydrogenase catalytic domain-containing protein [Gammaproteobacteria bacterium]
MRAIVCEAFGPPSNLNIEVDDPVPDRPMSCFASSRRASVTSTHSWLPRLYQIKPPLPYTPGNEIAGVIERAGDNVKHLRIGQRVLAMPGQGGLAEKIALPNSPAPSFPTCCHPMRLPVF